MARTTPVHAGYTIINGTGTGSNGHRIDVWIEYKQESQSIENNNTRVIAYLYAALKSGESSSTWGNDGCDSAFSVNSVSGTNLKDNGSYDFRITTPILMGSFDGNIEHTVDGTKTIAMAGSFATTSEYISGGNVSGNVTLTAINRGLVWVRVGGNWKQALPYVRVSGAWKLAQSYSRVSGTWKLGV